MAVRALLAHVALAGWLALGMAAEARHAAGSACVADTVGFDPAQADTALLAFNCRGWGQVFLARDSLIRAITVWRYVPPDTNITSVQLFITEVDSVSNMPNTWRIVLSGPRLISLAGDGHHPVPYRFVLDPPFALPYRGRFFLVVIVEDFSYLQFLGTRRNLYKEGRAWATGPDEICVPGGARERDPALDLIFKIEFCSEVATPALRRSWGELKVIYR